MYTGAIPASEGKIRAASLASLTRLGPRSPLGEKGSSEVGAFYQAVSLDGGRFHRPVTITRNDNCGAVSIDLDVA